MVSNPQSTQGPRGPHYQLAPVSAPSLDLSKEQYKVYLDNYREYVEFVHQWRAERHEAKDAAVREVREGKAEQSAGTKLEGAVKAPPSRSRNRTRRKAAKARRRADKLAVREAEKQVAQAGKARAARRAAMAAATLERERKLSSTTTSRARRTTRRRQQRDARREAALAEKRVMQELAEKAKSAEAQRLRALAEKRERAKQAAETARVEAGIPGATVLTGDPLADMLRRNAQQLATEVNKQRPAGGKKPAAPRGPKGGPRGGSNRGGNPSSSRT